MASRETHALCQALSTPGLIELHDPPIHTLPGHKIDSYEALARIRDQGELILPSAFLPLVNSRRLETSFDLAVLSQLDADLNSGLLPAGCGISINLSAQSIPHAEVVSQLMLLSRHGDRHLRGCPPILPQRRRGRTYQCPQRKRGAGESGRATMGRRGGVEQRGVS